MLNIVVYCPVSTQFNKDTVLKDWPKIVKDKIIKEAGKFFKEEDISVAFIPVSAVNHPALAIIYCDRRTKNLTASLRSEFSFDHMINDALLSTRQDKKFSVHMIFSDSSRTVSLGEKSKHIVDYR